MKRIIVLVVLMGICCNTVGAQISLPESYYVNRAKAALKAEEDARDWEFAVVGTTKGELSYVVMNGERKVYEPKTQQVKPQMYWNWSFYSSVCVAKDYHLGKEENVNVETETFASLLQTMGKEKWALFNCFGSDEGEVYVFTRKAKPKSKK